MEGTGKRSESTCQGRRSILGLFFYAANITRVSVSMAVAGSRTHKALTFNNLQWTIVSSSRRHFSFVCSLTLILLLKNDSFLGSFAFVSSYRVNIRKTRVTDSFVSILWRRWNPTLHATIFFPSPSPLRTTPLRQHIIIHWLLHITTGTGSL